MNFFFFNLTKQFIFYNTNIVTYITPNTVLFVNNSSTTS